MADVVSLKDLLPKSGYLTPCNGCGACCLMAQCSVSMMLFGEVEGVCPALERTGEKTFGCGLMSRPRDFLMIPEEVAPFMAEAISVCLGAGNGCDAPSREEWTPEGRAELLRRAGASYDAASPEARTILEAWGARRP